MSNINVNNSGNMTGVAIGDGAQVTAEKIIANIRQQLPPSASKTDELKAILKAALEELTKEELEAEARQEAEQTVGKIEKEMAKPEPNGKLVKGWLGTVDAVSETVGKIVRSAAAIAALFT